MSSSVSSVYINVIEDVVNKVRDEFNYSAGEAVLNELQALWEAKMMQCGVISGNIERRRIQRHAGPAAPVHDLNVPYEGPTEEYETPTAELLFPPTPMQTPLPQTPMLGMVDYNIPTGPSDFAGTLVNDTRNDLDIKAGQPCPYMQPPSSWMNQRPLGVDVNVVYDEGRDELDRGSSQQQLTQDFFLMSSGKRKRDEYQLTPGPYMPQQDGSSDIPIEFLLPEAKGVKNSSGKDQEIAIDAACFSQEAKAGYLLSQQDGIHDEYDNLFPYGGVATEDYNAVNTPADHVELQLGTPFVGTPRPTKSEAVDDDEPPLNEDDDDDDDLDELEHGEEEPQTQHIVLAQFDKVTRTKSRWKCTLKDGIMHLNGRDILFNKAAGEFDF